MDSDDIDQNLQDSLDILQGGSGRPRAVSGVEKPSTANNPKRARSDKQLEALRKARERKTVKMATTKEIDKMKGGFIGTLKKAVMAVLVPLATAYVVSMVKGYLNPPPCAPCLAVEGVAEEPQGVPAVPVTPVVVAVEQGPEEKPVQISTRQFSRVQFIDIPDELLPGGMY